MLSTSYYVAQLQFFCLLAPEAAPVGVSSSRVMATSLTLAWLPPQTPNGMIRHYVVLVHEVNTGANFSHQALSHTSFSIGDLHPFYVYQFRVAAVTVEAGPPSLPHVVTTLEDGKFLPRQFQVVTNEFTFQFLLPHLSVLPSQQLTRGLC